MNSLKIGSVWEINRQTVFNQTNLFVIKPKSIEQQTHIVASINVHDVEIETDRLFVNGVYFFANSSFKKYPQNELIEITISVVCDNKETISWCIDQSTFIPLQKLINTTIVLRITADISLSLLHTFVLLWTDPIIVPIFISPLNQQIRVYRHASLNDDKSFWESRMKNWIEQHQLLTNYPIPQIKNLYSDYLTLEGNQKFDMSGVFFTTIHYPHTRLFFRIHAQIESGCAFLFCESENSKIQYCPRSYEWNIHNENIDYQFMIPPPQHVEQKINIGILFHKNHVNPVIKIIDWYCIRMKSDNSKIANPNIATDVNSSVSADDDVVKSISSIINIPNTPKEYKSIYLTNLPPLYPADATVPIHLLTQVYIPTKIERLGEIQYCFNKMIQNQWITKIHAFAENVDAYQIFSLKYSHLSNVSFMNYNKRLTYGNAWNYAKINNLRGWIIIANSDVYLDHHLGNLHSFLPQSNLQTGHPILYALNRFEHNFYHPPILYGKQYAMYLNSPWMKPYEESLFSQDAWIIHSNTLHHTDNVQMPSPAELDINIGGTPGCDNLIAFIFAKNNWIVCNPCTFLPVVHFDHTSLVKDRETGKYIGKGGISSKLKPIGGIDTYLFLPTLRTPPTLEMGIPAWKTQINLIHEKASNELDVQIRFHKRIHRIQLTSPRFLMFPQDIDPNPGTYKWYLNSHQGAFTGIHQINELWRPTEKNKFFIIQSPRVEKWSVIDISGPEPKNAIGETEPILEEFPTEIAIYIIVLPNEMKPLCGSWGSHYWPAVMSSCMDSTRRIYLPPEARGFGLAIEITKWKGGAPSARIQAYIDGFDAPFPVSPWWNLKSEENKTHVAIQKWKRIFWDHKYWAFMTSDTFWKGHWNVKLNLDLECAKFQINEENWHKLQLQLVKTQRTGWDILGWKNFQAWKNYWISFEREHQNTFWEHWATPAGEPISDFDNNCTVADISIVISIKNRKEHLLNNLASWLYHTEVKEVILVDWSSSPTVEQILLTHKQGDDPRIRIVRVENQDTFIRTWCQNWGVRWARYPVLFKLDVDIQLVPGWINKNPMFPGIYRAGDWRFARNKNETYTHGSVLCWSRDYWWINGYNERITTYGYDDCDFYYRLQISGINRCIFDFDYWHHLPHNDHARIKEIDTSMNPDHEIIKNQNKIIQYPPWNRADQLQKFNILSVCSRIVISEVVS